MGRNMDAELKEWEIISKYNRSEILPVCISDIEEIEKREKIIKEQSLRHQAIYDYVKDSSMSIYDICCITNIRIAKLMGFVYGYSPLSDKDLNKLKSNFWYKNIFSRNLKQLIKLNEELKMVR